MCGKIKLLHCIAYVEERNMTNKILIGLAGRGTIDGVFASTARAGKDEVARVLRDDLGFRTYSFALPLKQVSQVLFGLTEDQMWNDKIKNLAIDTWGLSPRTIFQRIGTEGGRLIFDEDMWAKMAMFVWDDVKKRKPYALTHAADVAQLGPKPKSKDAFDALLHNAAKTMFQLEDADIARSQSTQAPLERWPFTFDEIKEKIKTQSIPAVLNMPEKEAWKKFIEIRQTLPMVEKCSNGPYGTPPVEANGMSIPDARFDNEASIVLSIGGTIVHVCRELPLDVELVTGHASECGVTQKSGDLYIHNDGSLEELRLKTLAMVEEIAPGFTSSRSSPSP